MILRQSYTLTVDLGSESLEDLAIRIKKPTSLSFIDLPEISIQEAELGYYNFTIPGEVIDELGTYIFQIMGYETEKFVQRESVPTPPYSVESPEVCVVTGNVKNISGGLSIYPQTAIEARPLHLPALYSGTYVLSDRVVVYSDQNGHFQLPLIRGMTAIVEIKNAGIRFQAQVPHQDSIRIEDLIPTS